MILAYCYFAIPALALASPQVLLCVSWQVIRDICWPFCLIFPSALCEALQVLRTPYPASFSYSWVKFTAMHWANQPPHIDIQSKSVYRMTWLGSCGRLLARNQDRSWYLRSSRCQFLPCWLYSLRSSMQLRCRTPSQSQKGKNLELSFCTWIPSSPGRIRWWQLNLLIWT